MVTIDIRKHKEQKIDVIEFADKAGFAATRLVKMHGCAFLASEHTTASDISSKAAAQNLIKALEKAIELGWWSE